MAKRCTPRNPCNTKRAQWWLDALNGSGVVTPETFVDKIDAYRTVDLGAFIFNSGNNVPTWRVFIPYDRKMAQTFTLNIDTADPSGYVKSTVEGGISSYYQAIQAAGRTGSWAAYGTNSSSNTSTVGGTIYANFTGIGFMFRHYTSTRGGVWRFVITRVSDSVVMATVDLSTYGTINQNKSDLVIDTLDHDTYNVVGTFMGDDPLNPPIGGASLGWACTNYTATNINKYDIPFYIIGSDTPNICKLYGTNIQNANMTVASYRSDNNFNVSFMSRAEGTSVQLADGWYPKHAGSLTSSACYFDDLATDRTCKVNGVGADILTTLTNYSFAVGGASIVLDMYANAYNANDGTQNVLWYANERYTFTSRGLKIYVKMDTAQDLDPSVFSPTANNSCMSQFSSGYSQLPKAVSDAGDELDGVGIDDPVEWYTKQEIIDGVFKGGIYMCRTSGTDLQKSYVSAYQFKNLKEAMQYDKAWNQEFWYWLQGTFLKFDPFVVIGGDVNAGDVFEWEAEYIYSQVPDAYNTLKPV